MGEAAIPDGVAALLSQHGVTGPVRWLHDPGEWVFLVSTTGAANMSERELVLSLQELLSAKVLVATDGPAWENHGRPL